MSGTLFPKGGPNPAGAYFTGQSYLSALSEAGVQIFNVTFEPGCRNFWHIHHAKSGGGQILLCTQGRGWYQEWGQEPRELHPGAVVNIPSEVKRPGVRSNFHKLCLWRGARHSTGTAAYG